MADVLVRHFDERAQQASTDATRKRPASGELPHSPDPPQALGSRAAATGDGEGPPGLSDSSTANPEEPQPSLASISKALAQLGVQLADVTAKLGKLTELAESAVTRAAEADRKATDAETKAINAEAKAASLAEEVQALRDQQARADRRSEGLDRALRRDKLMFFGVAETSETPPEELVGEHLRAVGSPAADKITEAVRLGSARATASSSRGPRPVRVTFAASSAVYDVFKHLKDLREQRKVYADRDLTDEQRAVRASLQGEYKHLRENGYRPFWRGERLLYPGERGSRPTEVHPGDDLPTGVRQAARASASPARST